MNSISLSAVIYGSFRLAELYVQGTGSGNNSYPIAPRARAGRYVITQNTGPTNEAILRIDGGVTFFNRQLNCRLHVDPAELHHNSKIHGY